MKAYDMKEWKFVGCSKTGLLFQHRGYGDFSITKEAIYLRGGQPRLYLKWTSDGVVAEHAHTRLTSEHSFVKLNAKEIYEALNNVLVV